jgi:TolB-like protein
VGPAAIRLLAGACLVLLGCAATASHRPAATDAVRPRVALMPLENLSGHPEAADLITRVVFAALGSTGRCELVEPGKVDAVLTELRIRTPGMLTGEDAASISSRLGAGYLLLGTILESGTVRTPDGEIPAVGIALRLVSGDSAKVLWSGLKIRTGEDRETIFGWGRERSLERIAERTAAGVLEDFHIPGPAGSSPSKGDRR